MVKPVLVGFNILLILLFGLFQKGNIEISHDLPDSLPKGGEAIVTVEVNKSDISGFAKYQITVAEGLTIEPVETAGSSFTFNNQKGKFIWMALPTAKKFTIQYRVVADNSADGSFNVSSRFSYIYESERRNYDLLDKDVIVGDGALMASNESAASDTSLSIDNSDVQVSMIRTLTPSGINNWKVNISIDKQNLEGYAKVEETIPEGYTAIDLKSSSAVFVLENEKVKYIWYDIPQNDNISVSYKLMPVIAVESSQPEITGTFTYLKNDDEVEMPIGKGARDFSSEELLVENKDTTNAQVSDGAVENGGKPMINGADIATAMNGADENLEETQEQADENDVASSITTKTAEIADNESQPENEKITEEKLNSTGEKDVVASKSNINNNIVNVPSPETGITYRIQIAAGHNNLRKTEFVKLYDFTEGYNLESLDGWLKYTTGSHEYYKQARNDRERISSQYDKFKGPFVTAYNDGERITVQEALMITNQEWLQ